MNYKSFSLTKDICIFIDVSLKIIYFRFKVNRTGYNKLLKGYEGRLISGRADSLFLAKYNKYYKAASFFLIKVFRDRNPCMIRSLILYSLCTRNDVKAALKTGVRKESGSLDGHSWIEIEGEPLNENRAFIDSFTVIHEV